MKRTKKFLIAIIPIVIFQACHRKDENKKTSKDKESKTTDSELIKEFNLETRKVYDGKIEVLLPKDFFLMDEETLEIKYPRENRPKIVFTNDLYSINFGVSHRTEFDNLNQKDFEKDYRNYLDSFENSIQNVEWETKKLTTLKNGQKALFLKFKSHAIDTDVYNNIIFTTFEEKMLLVTFNYTELDLEAKDWSKVVDLIINSIDF